MPSLADAVAKVGHATFSLENSDLLQLALFGAEVLEQRPPFAEQDRDQVDLELVEEPSGECALRDARPWTSTFLPPAACLTSRMAASMSFKYRTAGPTRREGHTPMA